MNLTATDDAILRGIKNGVGRLKDLFSRLTDFHGGPTTTEYMLTADVARGLVDCDIDEVGVERLYRELVSNLVTVYPRTDFGQTRVDVSVLDGLHAPRAAIEVKIRVRRFSQLREDVTRLLQLLNAIKPEQRGQTICFVVFQVYTSGGTELYNADDILKTVRAIEKPIQAQLLAFAGNHPDFDFQWFPLQGDEEGITPRRIEILDESGEGEWGEFGHAIRYHAIAIRAKPAS